MNRQHLFSSNTINAPNLGRNSVFNNLNNTQESYKGYQKVKYLLWVKPLHCFSTTGSFLTTEYLEVSNILIIFHFQRICTFFPS